MIETASGLETEPRINVIESVERTIGEGELVKILI